MYFDFPASELLCTLFEDISYLWLVFIHYCAMSVPRTILHLHFFLIISSFLFHHFRHCSSLKEHWAHQTLNPAEVFMRGSRDWPDSLRSDALNVYDWTGQISDSFAPEPLTWFQRPMHAVRHPYGQYRQWYLARRRYLRINLRAPGAISVHPRHLWYATHILVIIILPTHTSRNPQRAVSTFAFACACVVIPLFFFLPRLRDTMWLGSYGQMKWRLASLLCA